jgi:sec-independent protein translocase protein TatB
MFEVGFSELLLIFAIALVVLGPQRLPKLAQQVGRWVGRARAMARQFREQLEEEANNLEKQMDVDPGIDTSLDPKPKPQAAPPPAPPAPDASTAPSAPSAEAPPSAAVTPLETEEDFYPPDHHMHPSNRAQDPDPRTGDVPPPVDAGTGAGAQSELDLTSPTVPGDGPKP